jgi:FkbM family methyltransferase
MKNIFNSIKRFFLRDNTQNKPISNSSQKLTYNEESKLKILCDAREETQEICLQKFSRDELHKAPKRFSKHIKSLRRAKFSSSGTRDGLAYITLPNKRIFYGYKSKQNHLRAFEYISDTIPKELNPDTFLLSIDITQRYLTDFTWPPLDILPPSGGSIIEAGAYLGHKTIRFVDDIVKNEGRVLAIEMVPQNCDILGRNVIENNLENTIDILNIGVWKETGMMPIKGKGRQRNTLVKMGKLDNDIDLNVQVDTFDNIIESWGVPTIDLLFISVNGAEIEALHGLNRMAKRVRTIFVAAPYSINSKKNSEICKDILKQKGFYILPSDNKNRVIAKSFE